MTPKQIANAIIQFRIRQRVKNNTDDKFFTLLDMEQAPRLIKQIEEFLKKGRLTDIAESSLNDETFMTVFYPIITEKAGTLSLENCAPFLEIREDLAQTYSCTLLPENTQGNAAYTLQFNELLRKQAELLTAKTVDDCCRLAADILIADRNMNRINKGITITPAIYTLNNTEDHAAIVRELQHRFKTADDIQRLKDSLKKGALIHQLSDELHNALNLNYIDGCNAVHDAHVNKHPLIWQNFTDDEIQQMYGGLNAIVDDIRNNTPDLLDAFNRKYPYFDFEFFSQSEDVRLCKKIATEASLMTTAEHPSVPYKYPTQKEREKHEFYSPYADLLTDCSPVEIMLITQHMDYTTGFDHVPGQSDAEVVSRNRQLIREIHNDPAYRNQLLSDAISKMQSLDPGRIFAPVNTERFRYISDNLKAISTARYIDEIKEYIENPDNGFPNNAQKEDLQFGAGVYKAYNDSLSNAIKQSSPVYAVLTEIIQGEENISRTTDYHKKLRKFTPGQRVIFHLSSEIECLDVNFEVSPDMTQETKVLNMMKQFFSKQQNTMDLRPSKLKADGSGVALYSDLIDNYLGTNPAKTVLTDFMNSNGIKESADPSYAVVHTEKYVIDDDSPFFDESQAEPPVPQEIPLNLSYEEEYEGLRRYLQATAPDKLKAFDLKNPWLEKWSYFNNKFKQSEEAQNSKNILKHTKKVRFPNNAPEFNIVQDILPHDEIVRLAYIRNADFSYLNAPTQDEYDRIVQKNRNLLTDIIFDQKERNDCIRELIQDIRDLRPEMIFSQNVQERQAYMLENNTTLAMCYDVGAISDYINDPRNGFNDPKLIAEFNFAYGLYEAYRDQLDRTCKESHPIYSFMSQVAGGEEYIHRTFFADKKHPDAPVVNKSYSEVCSYFSSQGLMDIWEPHPDNEALSARLSGMIKVFSDPRNYDINNIITEISEKTDSLTLEELVYTYSEGDNTTMKLSNYAVMKYDPTDFDAFITEFNEAAKKDPMFQPSEKDDIPDMSLLTEKDRKKVFNTLADDALKVENIFEFMENAREAVKEYNKILNENIFSDDFKNLPDSVHKKAMEQNHTAANEDFKNFRESLQKIAKLQAGYDGLFFDEVTAAKQLLKEGRDHLVNMLAHHQMLQKDDAEFKEQQSEILNSINEKLLRVCCKLDPSVNEIALDEIEARIALIEKELQEDIQSEAADGNQPEIADNRQNTHEDIAPENAVRAEDDKKEQLEEKIVIPVQQEDENVDQSGKVQSEQGDVKDEQSEKAQIEQGDVKTEQSGKVQREQGEVKAEQPEKAQIEQEEKQKIEPFNVRARSATNGVYVQELSNKIYEAFGMIDSKMSIASDLPASMYKDELLKLLPEKYAIGNKYFGKLNYASQLFYKSDEKYFAKIAEIKEQLVADRNKMIMVLGCASALLEKSGLPEETEETLRKRIDEAKKDFNNKIPDVTKFEQEMKSITDEEIETAKKSIIATIEPRKQEMGDQQIVDTAPDENGPGPEENKLEQDENGPGQKENELGPDENELRSTKSESGPDKPDQSENIQLQENSEIRINNSFADDINIIDTSSHSNGNKVPEDSQSQENKEAEILRGIPKIRSELRKRAADLKKAKSPWKNSEEYKELIEAVQMIGNGTPLEMFKDLEPADQFTQELYLIHSLTEKYLAHKARDGVKKNVYQKLCAVEETSKIIENALALVGKRKLEYNQTINESMAVRLPGYTTEMNVSLDSRRRNLSPETAAQVPDLTDEEFDKGISSYREKNKQKASVIGEQNIGRVIRDVDNCMCKILIKAVDKPAASIKKSDVVALKAMRDYFLKNPLQPVKDEPEVDARSQAPVVQGPVH